MWLTITPVCVYEKFHSVYSTVEDERLQERTGQEGLSHTFPHIKLERERGVQVFTSKSVAKVFSNGVQNPKHLRVQRQS